jgi:hypothetical protein
MLIEEKPEFSAVLAAALAVYSRPITSGMADLYFSALQQYDMAVVRDALSRHLQDPLAGQYAPKPADVIRQIQASQHDGRPEGDEAWSIAALAFDERATAVLTDEIQAALCVAQPLLDLGDKVAARKAFLDAYARLVKAARADGKAAKWHVSLGHSVEGRTAAIEGAARLGRITQEAASHHLKLIGTEATTNDGQAIAGLITGNAPRGKVSQNVRENLAKIRASLTAGMEERKAKELACRKQADAELNAKVQKHLGIGDGVMPCHDAEERYL